MKWALASIGVLTLIVVFSFAALDQKNVVWTGDVAHCPHCRSEVNDYSNVCATCRQVFDWETREESCTACLSEPDAAWIRERTEKRQAEIAARFETEGLEPDAVKELLTWLVEIESGDCGYCGGTGRWLAPDYGKSEIGNGDGHPLTSWLMDRLEGDCPVCLGSGTCVLCDGDHRVTFARESAARELAVALDRMGELDVHRDAESTRLAWEEVRGFVSRNLGRHEVARLPAFDEPGEAYTGRAKRRLDAMSKLVTELP